MSQNIFNDKSLGIRQSTWAHALFLVGFTLSNLFGVVFCRSLFVHVLLAIVFPVFVVRLLSTSVSHCVPCRLVVRLLSTSVSHCVLCLLVLRLLSTSVSHCVLWLLFTASEYLLVSSNSSYEQWHKCYLHFHDERFILFFVDEMIID